MKTASVVLVALLATTTMSFGQYSTGFEYADQAAMTAGLAADGWVNVNFTANLETTIVHSGSSASFATSAQSIQSSAQGALRSTP